MTYKKLRSAIRTFGLGERATLDEIKTRYRELAKRHHPDGGIMEDTEAIYRVIEAHRVIPTTCLHRRMNRSSRSLQVIR